MPVNEALGILAQIVCIEGSLQDLKGDVCRHVPGPALRGLEARTRRALPYWPVRKSRMMV
jgi:hypothetical protein